MNDYCSWLGDGRIIQARQSIRTRRTREFSHGRPALARTVINQGVGGLSKNIVSWGEAKKGTKKVDQPPEGGGKTDAIDGRALNRIFTQLAIVMENSEGRCTVRVVRQSVLGEERYLDWLQNTNGR